MDDLNKKKGTIAYVFTQHQKEIFDLINQNKLEDARKLCLKLLDSEELIKNKATYKAKQIFSLRKGKQFLTVLTTYMYGMKAC